MHPITIFIHAALITGVKERIDHFIEYIEKCGLMEKVEMIYLSVVGNDLEHLSTIQHNKITIIRSSPNVTDYELPTLTRLFEHCKTHMNDKVLYLHTKGVGKDVNPCIEDWVQYMLYFLVEKHENALLKLDTSTTAGVDLRQEPVLHYSGNFWWANASYINTLPNPIDFNCLIRYPNPLQSVRHNQEFWICYKIDNHCSLWDCGINCYERHLHRYSRDLYCDSRSK